MFGPSASTVSGDGDDTQFHSQVPVQGSSSSLKQPGSVAVHDTDPASSLRTAALLTRRSKRKKPLGDSDATLPLRTRTPARLAIQLDYGQEEESSYTALPPKRDFLETATVSSAFLKDADDKQVAREEGEISDSEAAKLQSSAQKDPKRSKKANNLPKSSDSPSILAQPTHSEHIIVKVKTEPASPSIARFRVDPVSPSVPSAPPRQEVQSVPEQPATLQSMPFTIDENHVRPGLAMNQQQYDAAKDIVLDLLGWGVPPEHLLNCGLSREIVFYVFTELRLRLPANFDATDIPLYTEELLQSVYEGIVPSSSGPVPVGKLVSRSHTYPHLPLKQKGSQDLASSSTYPTLSVNAPPFFPSESSIPSLHDIEQQRRRELLARKAVLASLKAKQPQARRTPSPSPSPTASSVNEPVKDMEMAPVETVDDFLNSIGPVGDQATHSVNKADTTKSSDPSPVSTPNAMDVDQIPGFLTSEGPENWSTLVSVFTSSSEEIPLMSNSDIPTTIGEPASADSCRSNISFCSHLSDTGLPRLNGNGIVVPNGEEALSAPRRGMKRPVAADFVDYESESLLGSNGYGGRVAPPFSRRKLGSFASVSGMRRCVIDLSDSEDDGLEDNRLYRNSVHSPYPVPARQSSLLVSATAGSLSSTGTPSPGNAAIQPAALLEKEQEIKRMREMIAQREQNRLRKLVMSSRSTPVHSPSPMLTPGIGADTPSLCGQRLQSGSTTPTSINQVDEEGSDVHGHGNSGQDLEEDAVMNDILSIASTADTVTAPNSAEGSDPTTPIDTVSRTLKHQNTGDQVSIDEAQQEEAIDERADVDTSPEEPHGVDVDDVVGLETSSTQCVQGCEQSQGQISEDQAAARDRWTIYNSPLDSYPLLRWHSQISVDASVMASEFFFSSSSTQATLVSPSTPTADWLDLKPLKIAVACKTFDSEKRICQFEVPGGGECRDAQCEDMHIGRTSSIEPSDEDTAQYLYDRLSMSPTGQDKPSVKVIKDALEDVRRKKGLKMVFDDRVSIALSMLRLR